MFHQIHLLFLPIRDSLVVTPKFNGAFDLEDLCVSVEGADFVNFLLFDPAQNIILNATVSYTSTI